MALWNRKRIEAIGSAWFARPFIVDEAAGVKIRGRRDVMMIRVRETKTGKEHDVPVSEIYDPHEPDPNAPRPMTGSRRYVTPLDSQ